MKKILFATSEAVPFIKTGGLADVAGTLPKYFDKKKYDVRVMLPKYMCMKEEWKSKMQYVTHFYLELAWRSHFTLLIMNITLQDGHHTAISMKTLRNLLFSRELC